MRNINSENKENDMGRHEIETITTNAVGGTGHGTPLRLGKKQIETFLAAHSRCGCAGDTIRQYRTTILAFRDFLPESWTVSRNSLAQWQAALLEQG